MASSVQAARQDAVGWKAMSIGPTGFNAPAVGAVTLLFDWCQGHARVLLPATRTPYWLLRAAILAETLRNLWSRPFGQ